MDAIDRPGRLPPWLRAALFAAMLSVSLPAIAASFDSANAAYEGGNFDTSREAYQALIDSGKRSANVFYNLANTEFRSGNIGLAILNYERALALEPAHPEARHNLRIAREQSGARTAQGEWYDVFFPVWRPDVFAWAAVAAGWLLVFSLAYRRMARTRGSGSVGLAFLAIFVAGYAGAGLWYTGRDQSSAIVVSSKEAVARVGPAEQSSVATTLPPGSRVRVLSERGEWVYCELPSASRAWLPAADVQLVRLSI
jgi:tetratricopeptide (TPR) repeat protein